MSNMKKCNCGTFDPNNHGELCEIIKPQKKTKRKTIGIVGDGYVGSAMANFFRDHYDVVMKGLDQLTYWKENDIASSRSTNNDDFDLINACDFVVIAVPTPMKDDGTVNTSIVEDVLNKITVPLILIKSTVPPMFTERMNKKHKDKMICFSPEYLGEGKYVVQWWKDKGYPHATDMKYHDFQIFGGDKKATHVIIQYFMKVLGPDPKYIQTDSTTAELCKYMENAWGGMKVTFCHEFHDIAKALDVDYSELRELWLLDGRVERMHTAVFEDDKGFGGKCFPKDINGIYHVARNLGVNTKVLRAIIERNDDTQRN